MMNAIQASIIERMAVSGLWDLGFHGQGITVAVLDSGMMPDPPFSEKIVYDMDFTGEGKPRGDAHWHGTLVAECVNAIAGQASIANLRVVPSDPAPLKRDTVISALQHCIDVYPLYRVINISLSFEHSKCPDNCPLCNKVDEAYEKGMLVIVAAGNEGPKADTLTCPARAQWAIANVATWTQTEEDYWKQHWIKKFLYTQTGMFKETYGTSFSAGYSSGASALLFSALPKLDADTLRFAMLEVDKALHTETGHQTTLKVNRVYDYLLELRKLASNPRILITKNGALRPQLEPF